MDKIQIPITTLDQTSSAMSPMDKNKSFVLSTLTNHK
jgi:hypothetical protein